MKPIFSYQIINRPIVHVVRHYSTKTNVGFNGFHGFKLHRSNDVLLNLRDRGPLKLQYLSYGNEGNTRNVEVIQIETEDAAEIKKALLRDNGNFLQGDTNFVA